MGFSAMSSLAHDAESLMDLLRQGRIAPQADDAAHPARRASLASSAWSIVPRREQPVDDGERAPLQTEPAGPPARHDRRRRATTPAADDRAAARARGNAGADDARRMRQARA